MSFFREQPLTPSRATISGGQASFGALWDAARDAAIFVDNFTASAAALEEAYDRRIDLVKRETGVVIPNPMRMPQTLNEQMGGPQPRYGIGVTLQQSEANFAAALERVGKQFPAKAQILKIGVPVSQEAEQIAYQAEERFGRFFASRRDVVGSWAAALGGSFSGSLRDPLQVMTLIAGGGPGAARTIGGRILTTAFREMAINAGVEATLQPKVQAWREQAGLPAGFGEAAKNVALTGALAGAFGGTLQTVIEVGGRLLLKGPALEQAARLAAQSLPEGHPVRQALEGSPEASQSLLEPIREALPPEGRGALDAGAASRPGNEAAQADALRFAEDPQTSRISFADIRGELRRDLGPAPQGRAPTSLLGFLARSGGLKADAELTHIGADDWFGPGGRLMRREGGLQLDEARRLAVEAGYLADSRFEEGASTSTVADLLDAIDRELRGDPVYSRADGDAADFAREKQLHADAAASIDRALAGLEDVATDNLPRAVKLRAARIMLDENADADLALERAIMEDYHADGDAEPFKAEDGSDIPFALDRGAGAQSRAAEGAGRAGERPAAQSAARADDGGPYGAPRTEEAQDTGGIDEPDSTDEIALTDEMIAELDPDGEFAKSNELTAALAAEADELSDLAAFLKACKVA